MTPYADPKVIAAHLRPVDAPPPGAGWMRHFVWRDPATIPQRQWLYGGHYLRRYVTTTVAPGGLGKSALVLVETLAMVTGKPLLGVQPVEPQLRAWLWNGEDPNDETERRVAAAAMFYGLEPSDLEDGLMIGSGRDEDLVIAEQTRDGTEIIAPNVERLINLIRDHAIDLVVIDPFVSSHRVTENDNNAIDRVAKTWARIAEATNAAIELVHHVRKGTAGAETTVEDGRGAVALLAAARSARVLNVMSEAEAAKAGVERRRSYFRVDNGKSNLAPPPDGSDWYRFTSQKLGNGGVDGGDSVGVVEAWKWPNHREGIRAEDLLRVQMRVASGTWRGSIQSNEWVGKAVAEVLGLDLSSKLDKAKADSLVKMWLQSGALTIEQRKDAKGTERPFIVVGNLVSLETETFS